MGIDNNTATREFINRMNYSVNQSNVDTTTGADTSKTTRNWMKDFERESTINGHPQTTIAPMEVHTTSNYALGGTQALVEDEMDNVTVVALETTSNAHLRTETIVSVTSIYVTPQRTGGKFQADLQL